MIRVFVAIDLPKELKKELRKLKIDIPDSRINWVDDFHLTLKFIGYIEKNDLKSIKEKLSRVKFKPFKLSFTDVGYFPTEKSPRVIWVGVEPHEEVIELQEKVDDKLIKYKDDYKFHPHITLARIKSIKDKSFLKKIKFVKGGFRIKSFKLIQSKLIKKETEYIELFSFDSQ